MFSERKPDAPVRIGEWLADPATNELRRGDECVRLEPKSMDVLMLLAARAGNVVSREELFAHVWPGMVVGDEALTQSVTKLRRALGDDPRSPAYIETLSKRGYRLRAATGPAAAAEPRRWRWLAPVALAAGIVVAWAYFATPATEAGSAPEARTATEWVTVTVLPFESLDRDPAQAYLARGIGDSLMTELGRVSALRMIGSAGTSPEEAARHARYVVAGSVQREAGRIRVHARLIDTRTREQLWSERFERPAGELFALQDEIIARVAAALPAQLSASERQRLAWRHTRSLEAYDHFLRAQALFLARGRPENDEARAHYRKAIELDPRFARAYAGLAMSHAIEHRLSGASAGAPGLQRAFELAQSASLIDPEVAEVHWALGFVHAQARRHPEALASLRRAIELNASFADAYALMAGVLTYVGEPARSIPLLRTALRLEPEGGYLYYLVLGRAYFFENDLEQALINLRAAVARNAADLESRIYLAAALAASGDPTAAEWEAQEVRALDGAFELDAWLQAYPLTSAPLRERLRAALVRAGLR